MAEGHLQRHEGTLGQQNMTLRLLVGRQGFPSGMTKGAKKK